MTLYSSQHNEVYEVNAFYAEMFSFLFVIVTWLQFAVKALNVTHGNSFSNQWAFTMLETEVFKYNFENLCYKSYAVYFDEICAVYVKWIVIS